jgi:predicted metal-binding protein
MNKKTAMNKEIKELEKFALDNGASRAKIFPAASVAIDERVRMKCQIPLCPHYGRTLTCPPNVPTVEEFRKTLSLYKKAIMVQTTSPLVNPMESYDKEEVKEFFKSPGKGGKKKREEKTEAPNDFGNVRDAAKKLHKLINEVELKAMSMGFPYALGLIGGECMLCTECVGVGSSEGCRRPFEARPSLEGVGIDVIRTSQKAGLPFECPPKKEIVWSGLVLID